MRITGGRSLRARDMCQAPLSFPNHDPFTPMQTYIVEQGAAAIGPCRLDRERKLGRVVHHLIRRLSKPLRRRKPSYWMLVARTIGECRLSSCPWPANQSIISHKRL